MGKASWGGGEGREEKFPTVKRKDDRKEKGYKSNSGVYSPTSNRNGIPDTHSLFMSPVTSTTNGGQVKIIKTQEATCTCNSEPHR